MNLLFQIHNLQLLIVCMDDHEFVANMNCICLCFSSNIIKVSHFLHCFVLLLHLVSFFFFYISNLYVPYAYVSIKSMDCILLLSLTLNTIFLISLVNTLFFLLLNFCYAFYTKAICVNFITLGMVYFIFKLSCF